MIYNNALTTENKKNTGMKIAILSDIHGNT